MKKWLRNKAISWLTKDLIGMPESMIIITKHGWYLGDEKLTPQQAQKISKDAQTFQDSMLWRVIKAKIEKHSIEKGFKQSQSIDDQIIGKALIYWTDIVDKDLQRMSKS